MLDIAAGLPRSFAVGTSWAAVPSCSPNTRVGFSVLRSPTGPPQKQPSRKASAFCLARLPPGSLFFHHHLESVGFQAVLGWLSFCLVFARRAVTYRIEAQPTSLQLSLSTGFTQSRVSAINSKQRHYAY